MSGENSKRSGEIGEKLADSYLELIGWSSGLQAIPIKCNDDSHRTAKDDLRRSHGDDRVFVYNNPFFDHQTDVVHISVKNSSKGYPTSEAVTKTEFKNFVEELNEIISCAQYDEGLDGLLDTYERRRHLEHAGLLIWTSSDFGSHDKDVLSLVRNIKSLDDKCIHNVYFVDGARIEFTRKMVEHLRSNSPGGYSFIYPEPGALINRNDERHGRALPLSLVIADVIPAKVIAATGEEVLFLYANQAFDREAYMRLLNLALVIAGAWPQKVFIGFRDYNDAIHSNDARSAELAFQDRKKSFHPFSFEPSNLASLSAVSTGDE
ncbi:hypothetical protein ACL58G_29235 [Massilia sp. GER05]|uniref:hypothetical protein n=1 Tax=Massilia sp. GER05 TaxID=3394605 RepID=UPI003F825389